MSAAVLSLCKKGVLRSALSRALTAPSGFAVEARATSSSKVSKSGFWDLCSTVPAEGAGTDISRAAPEEGLTENTKAKVRAIIVNLRVLVIVIGGRSSTLVRLCPRLCFHDALAIPSRPASQDG